MLSRKALKKGIDNLIPDTRDSIQDKEDDIRDEDIKDIKEHIPDTKESIPDKGITYTKDGIREKGDDISDPLISKAKKESEHYPRVTIYSPTSSAVLRYLTLTVPRFKMSETAAAILEAGLKKKYPEQYAKFKDSNN
jgi:hypothetical protein